jgi:hypothetical protein
MLYECIYWQPHGVDPQTYRFTKQFMIFPEETFRSADDLVASIRQFCSENDFIQSHCSVEMQCRSEELFQTRLPYLSLLEGLAPDLLVGRHYLLDNMMSREICAFMGDPVKYPYHHLFTVRLRASAIQTSVYVLDGQAMYFGNRVDAVANRLFSQAFLLVFETNDMDFYQTFRSKLYKWLIYKDIDPGFHPFW